MYEGFLTIFIFIGVMAIAGVLFAGWLFVVIVRGGMRVLTRLLGGASGAPNEMPVNAVICRHERCRAPNPAVARFCRRCGRSIGGAAAESHPQPMRRVAMW